MLSSRICWGIYIRAVCTSSICQSRNFYDVLEISPSATHAEIKAAYFKLTKKHHPDVSSHPGSKDNFQELLEAYETLRNPDKRRLYDNTTLRSHKTFDTENHPVSGHWRQKVHREFHRTHPNAPPTGSWKHYNFDEWYEGHYPKSQPTYQDQQIRESIQNIIRMERENYVPPSKRLLRLIPVVVFNTVILTILISELR